MKFLQHEFIGRKHISFKPSLFQLSQQPPCLPVLLEEQWAASGIFPFTLPFVPALLEMLFLGHSGITFALFVATQNEWAIAILLSVMYPAPTSSQGFLMEHWASRRTCIYQNLSTRTCTFVFRSEFHASFNSTVAKFVYFFFYKILALFCFDKSNAIRIFHF